MPALKTRLLLPEYGRNVQKMVQFLSTIEDRELRNRQAEIVITTMAGVYPQRRDTPEFRNMLYDHLFMIADFELDIDAPFEKPLPEQFSPTPERLISTQKYVSQKQYGSIVPRMMRELVAIEDEGKKLEMAASLAKFMRQKSYDYNKEFPSDEVVLNDLYDMSDGTIRLDASIFEGTQITQRVQKPSNNKNNNNRGNNKNSNNNNNNRNRKPNKNQ